MAPSVGFWATMTTGAAAAVPLGAAAAVAVVVEVAGRVVVATGAALDGEAELVELLPFDPPQAAAAKSDANRAEVMRARIINGAPKAFGKSELHLCYACNHDSVSP